MGYIRTTISWNTSRKRDDFFGFTWIIYSARGHSKSTFVEEGRGVIEKRTKTNRGRMGGGGRGPSMCVRSFKKKMLRFSKWSFINILQFSYWLWCQCEILNKPSWKIIIISPVNEMATYSLVIDNVYVAISSEVY